MPKPTPRQHARTETERLVENFQRQLVGHKLTAFNETQTRRDFLDPWLAALGWDTENRRSLPQPLREVYMEAQVLVEGKLKFPDYEFRIDGQPRFFLEAKKPSVNLHDDWKPANQIRLYSWSAKLPVGVLTDFEELSIYDCRQQPSYQDPAGVGRHKYFTYDTYLDHFDYLYDLLGREAVAAGALYTLAQALPTQRGTLSVDKAFLATLEQMREKLAVALARHNRDLKAPELRFLVQALLDRIIFLRIAEDRGIEPYQNLLRVLDSATRLGSDAPYAALLDRFREAQNRYNSGLFDLRADTLSAKIKLPHLELRPLLENLYYPRSPYQFSVMGADILGSAYERFLGKVIDVPQPGQVVIEEKPAVRKAGGVYYTPDYIVRYLVQHTLGPLCEGRTPAQVAQLRVLDPACGSGSFLLGAYEYLLNWHLRYYQANPKVAIYVHPPQPPATPRGAQKSRAKTEPALTADGRLCTALRKAILLNNIFGVDLDEQAVEVSKLSLLLRCLEGETAQAPAAAQFAYDRLLPTLDANVRCGNSLVGPDYFDQPNPSPEVNPFDWHTEFADVFRQGGFDAVIGNPPYVRSQFISESIKEYFLNNYPAASYQPDTFAFFITKAVALLNSRGRAGYIIPSGLLTNTYYEPLRKFILTKTSVNQIIDLKGGIFKDAAVDTFLLIFTKEVEAEKREGNFINIGVDQNAKNVGFVTLPSTIAKQIDLLSSIGSLFNTSSTDADRLLTIRLQNNFLPLDKYVSVKAGMKVRKDFVAQEQKSAKYQKFLMGADVKPNYIEWKGRWVCYDKSLEVQFSNQAFREERIFTDPDKVLVRQVMGKERIFAAADTNSYFVDQSLYVLSMKKDGYAAGFVAGVLSSTLLAFFFTKTMADNKATFPKIKGDQLKQLPIPTLNLKNKIDRAAHDAIVTQVNLLLELHPQLAAATVPSQRQPLATRVRRAEDTLDTLVFDLYGLTEAERAVVRGEQRSWA